MNKFGGLGATVIDSLDTLYIMGLADEFKAARTFVAERFDPIASKDHLNVFETTIRFLGGLISAYDLSGAQTKGSESYTGSASDNHRDSSSLAF